MSQKKEKPMVRSEPGARYSPELADSILHRMTKGESLRSICRGKGMPTETAVRLWAVRDPEGFGSRYASAMVARCDFWADEILEISDDSSQDTIIVTENGREVEKVDHEHINRSRLRVDSRKWLMSKLAPGKYGDKVAIDHSVKGDAAMVVVVNVVAAQPAAPAIDVTPDRVALAESGQDS